MTRTFTAYRKLRLIHAAAEAAIQAADFGVDPGETLAAIAELAADAAGDLEPVRPASGPLAMRTPGATTGGAR
jgi:hypothetical protein